MPEWYQKRFLPEGLSRQYYLDLRPETLVQNGHKIIRNARNRWCPGKCFAQDDVVAAGELLMEIVPQDRELVIDAQFAPRDADDLSIGLEAQVRFTAIQERSVPVLVGKISSVSADSYFDERSGIPYFTAQI